MKKYFFRMVLAVLGIVILFNWDWVTYFYMQARGGLDVAFNTRPIADMAKDPSVPDSLKARLRYIDEVKRFAIDSLGLRDIEKNYRTLYDQHGKPLVYVLVVANKYDLGQQFWWFPFIGNFAYKGFFDIERAKKEEQGFINKGFDTRINEASAYSTLGYLPEPILSSMLWRSDGQLANLIMHEMTHSTVFVKDDHELSENLANFVGDYGAERFLTHKFGNSHEKLKEYQQRKVFWDAFAKHTNRGTMMLDTMYRGFKPQMTPQQKDQRKQNLIRRIAKTEDTLYKNLPNLKFRVFDTTNLPNNAFFVGFQTYHSQQNQMDSLFRYQFRGNFKGFLNHWKNRYNQ